MKVAVEDGIVFEDEASSDPPSGQFHTCDACGKHDVWGPGWCWYGSWKQYEDFGLPGVERIFKACSMACMKLRNEVKVPA